MNKKSLFCGLVLLGYAIILAIFYYSRLNGPDSQLLFELFTFVTPAIVVTAGIYAFLFFGAKSLQGKSILLMTIAFALWLTADTYWLLTGNKSVSLADILWLIGYPLIFTAILFGIKSIKEDFFEDWTRLIFTGAISLAAAGIYFNFLFPGTWSQGASLLENIVHSGYIVADMILLIPIILLIPLVIGGSISKPWTVFALGFLVYLVADTLYAIYAGPYAAGNHFAQLIDLCWYAGYLLFAFALVYWRAKAEEITTA